MMVSRKKATHLVSLLSHEILDLVGTNKLSADDAERLFSVIEENGFVPQHKSFAQGLKALSREVEKVNQ